MSLAQLSPSLFYFLLVGFGEGYSCCYLLRYFWQGENKVNSYSVQLKFSLICKFGVEFDKKWCKATNTKVVEKTFQGELHWLGSVVLLLSMWGVVNVSVFGFVFIVDVIFIVDDIFIFEVIYILRSSSQSTWWIDQICFLQHQNPTWKTWDKNFECGTAQPS